nr:hypothetical protein [Tanacetum cinerariifolium]
MAMPAVPLAAAAEPALKPNQPTHSMAAPTRASHTGVDVNNGAAREIEHAPVPQKTADATPDHVRNRCINQREPDRHEDQHRGELHAFRERADDQRRGDDREGHLERNENGFGEQCRRACDASGRDACQERLRETADEGVEVDDVGFHPGGVERHAVANVFGANHAAVEQRQTGDGHEQHQGGRGQHPGGVAGIEYRGCHFVCRHGQARDCVGIGFAGTDADGLFQIDHEDLAVTDLAGVGRFGYRFDNAVQILVVDRNIDLHLGEEVDYIFRTAVELGVALLTSEAFDFSNRDALHADFGQRLAYVVQLERLDDGSD